MENLDIKNILIVDDHLENLQIITDFIENSRLPYKILKAPSGIIGLKIIKKKLPDLIITDWEMPDLNGIEFIKKVKKDKNSTNIPVIMCTGVMTTSENLQTALDAGAIDYIRKPIDKIELFARIRSALILAESQNKVMQQNIELSELNETKDKLFSIIGHDLRSPFGSAIGMMKLLVKDINKYDKDKIEKYIRTMLTGVENGFKLLDNLLEWSKLQIDKTQFNPNEFNIKSIIDDNIYLLKVSAENKNINLSSNCNNNILVFADKNMINTVIRNLISNSIKFTPKGGVVSIDCIEKSDNVHIKISDNGIGIKEENIEKIFKMDIGFTTYGTENEEGTGLGLCLCNEFIQKHNNKLTVQSEEGKGSVFSFILPIVKKIESLTV